MISGNGNHTISSGSAGFGAFVQGYCKSPGPGTIYANSGGAFVQGMTRGANSSLSATGVGSFAQGYAKGGEYILASNIGSSAIGAVNNNGFNLISSGQGAFACGSATTAHIEAAATNSFQFGPGYLNEAVAFQVGVAGTGIALKGTSGVFAAQNDGQIWNTSGDVIIRSNAHDVSIDLNQNYTITLDTVDGEVTTFDANTPTTQNIANVLATFIKHHIDAGQAQ